MKPTVFSFRVPSEELASWKAVAASLHITPSELVRRALRHQRSPGVYAEMSAGSQHGGLTIYSSVPLYRGGIVAPCEVTYVE